MPHPTLREQLEATPFPTTVNKYWEAWYFLLGMCEQYHDPYAFRYELNAFIQSLRNITFMLQSEPARPQDFDVWYANEQQLLRADGNLRRFVDARNIIVKQSNLATASKADLGIFRRRQFKLGLNMDLSPFHDSEYLIRKAQEFMIGFMLDPEHSQIGEQIGLRRTWIAPVLGPTEVVGLCASGLAKIGKLLQRVHCHCNTTFDAAFNMPDMDGVFVRLESDIDPTLPEKWGWINTLRSSPNSDA